MKVWPFPILRNYGTDEGLTELFLRFAADETLEVTETDAYYMTVKGTHGKLRFWCANKWYAWAQDGTYTMPDGRKAGWRNEMPSRWAVKKMREALARRRFSFSVQLAQLQ
jgi:hypothetical protein